MYYLCSENKGADELRSNAQLICAFVLLHAKIRVSNAAAHMILMLTKQNDLSPFIFFFSVYDARGHADVGIDYSALNPNKQRKRTSRVDTLAIRSQTKGRP